MKKIAELNHVDFETFQNDVVPANEPAVFRSLVAEWPAVEQCRSSAAATCQYLKKLDIGTPVYTIAAPPDAGGRFFYRDDLQGVNFKRGQIPLSQVLGQLQAQSNDGGSHAIAVQALSVRDTLPTFEKDNPKSRK